MPAFRMRFVVPNDECGSGEGETGLFPHHVRRVARVDQVPELILVEDFTASKPTRRGTDFPQQFTPNAPPFVS